MGMTTDNRKRTRVSVHFDIAILMDDEINPLQAQLINLSMTGILCTSQPAFLPNTPCKVILSLTGETRIVIDSRIVRVGPQETAIRFISMDEDSFNLLKNVVEYNAEEPDLIDREFRTDAFGKKAD